jgi:squalene-hopene/tetraprenyl-beta-curcumene cyclase
LFYIDLDRLLAAHEKAQDDLLAERVPRGNWVGELASSALATATAVSALALVQHSRHGGQANKVQGDDWGPASWDLRPLIRRGLTYLATQQNTDGGFGDTDLSHSNIATTMLVRAAFHLAGAGGQDTECSPNDSTAQAQHCNLLDRAARYVQARGGIGGLRARYGKDKTFAVPILTNCALAGLVDWREVSPLPFELAAFPQSWYRFFRLPVVSYAIPALVAIGQARFFHCKPRNPLIRAVRVASIKRTLSVLDRMQPSSGGYLEAIPLTSFVVMSLAGTGRADHPVARRGVKFLLDTARPDGSWPIDTNLATWVTTLAINALQGSGFPPRRAGMVQGSARVRSAECGVRNRTSPRSQVPSPKSPDELNQPKTWGLGPGTLSDSVVEWLLSCQHNERHPFTGAAPGGWGWSSLSGAVPDADDTAGALLALAKFADPKEFNRRAPHGPGTYGRAYSAVIRGTCWLANLQNRDSGWPTFCRGWGTLPFDRSSPDLTAHAMRALSAWIELGKWDTNGPNRFADRIERGFTYLAKSQRPDGSWTPLWFGNQDHPQEENPVYGTSRVLLAYRDLQRMNDDTALRGVRWLIANQNADGGWGTASPKSGSTELAEVQVPSPKVVANSQRPGTWDLGPGTESGICGPPDSDLHPPVLNTPTGCGSSVEETAWALEGLLAGLDNRTLAVDNSMQNAIGQAVRWLVSAVEDGRHGQAAPVGFYFAKLWYYERLYPLVFTIAALGEVVRRTQNAIDHVEFTASANGQGNTQS